MYGNSKIQCRKNIRGKTSSFCTYNLLKISFKKSNSSQVIQVTI